MGLGQEVGHVIHSTNPTSIVINHKFIRPGAVPGCLLRGGGGGEQNDNIFAEHCASPEISLSGGLRHIFFSRPKNVPKLLP